MTHPSVLQDDDNDDNWLPLEEEEDEPKVERVASVRSMSTEPQTGRGRSSDIGTSQSLARVKDHEGDLRILQRKLEEKTKLKASLVDHPLDQAWQRFLVHLSRELWELELAVRVGVVLVIVGTVFQIIVMSTLFPWYHPRTIITAILLGVGWFYLMPNDPRDLISMIRLHDLSAIQIRYLLLSTFLVPTWLEARTLGFLSQTLCEAGWKYNFFVAMVISSIFLYRRTRQPQLSSLSHYYTSLYILYGGALWISLLRFNIRNIPRTAGPFLLSSGTLLLSHADKRQYTRALRHAMRLTLRDTLATLSDNVQQDEMLQLAMLRWIVDYWSTRPEQPTAASRPSAPASNTSAPGSPVVSTGNLLESGRERYPTSAPSPLETRQPTTSRPPTASTRRSSLRQLTDGQEIQWNDLLPMLDMTTNQMEDEVRHSPDEQDNVSVNNLRQMLSSMDVDERARPAVDAYKQYIQDVPPSREVALFISVARRCPAAWVLVWRYLMASAFALSSTLTMLPFLVIEVERIKRWAESCHGASAEEEQRPLNDVFSVETITSIPTEIEPMSLLFSPDRYSPLRPPTLLQVWFNIHGSVHALETGLTAARCAHTTAVAADFADNLMSLAQLGFEVSQKGWLHGLGIMTKELIHLHSTAEEGRYTSAAKSAIRNSQVISRNLQVLAEEDEPIIGFLQALVGRGWLWGHENLEPPIPESTVTITEIQEGDEDDHGNKEEESKQSDHRLIDEPVSETPEISSTENPVVKETVSPSEVKAVLEFLRTARKRDLISKAEESSLRKLMEGGPDKSACEGVKKSLTQLLVEADAKQEQLEAEAMEIQRQIDQVAKVKPMIIEAHDLGLIGDVQKISFEAILERQPAKSDVLMTTLSSILEKEAATREQEVSFRDDVCGAMQRVDRAFERGLISDAEKSSLSSALSGQPDERAVENIVHSISLLEEELEEREEKQPSPSNNEVFELVEKLNEIQRRGLISYAEKSSFEDALSNDPKGDVVESVKKTLAAILEESKLDPTGKHEVVDESSDEVLLIKEPESQAMENLAAIYSNSSWEEASHVDTDSKAEAFGSSSWEAQTTQPIEPAISTSLSPELASRLQLESEGDETRSSANQKEGSDFLKMVGGGLAILGAVVGTVALHHADKGEGHQRNQTSAGRVVELSSEPDDDGWVAVPVSEKSA